MEATLTPISTFVGSIDQQRAYRRRGIKAKAIAIAMIDGEDEAAAYEKNALAELELSSRCPVCSLELIGRDECPRAHGFDYDVNSEGDEI